jgi:DNA-binding NarL/FixJ family response regulator
MSHEVRRRSNPRLRRNSALTLRTPQVSVLLVEDHASVARAIARALSNLHAHANVVDTVERARAQLNDRSVAIAAVLADVCVGMQRFGGVDVLEHALLVRPEICAMAMTGLERTRELDDRIAALQLPFAPKPLDAHVLGAFVQRATAKHGVDRLRRIATIQAISDALPVPLTDAERETFLHLSYGLVAIEIAEAMEIDESTVRSHLDAIRRKLKVHSVNAIYGIFNREIFRGT